MHADCYGGLLQIVVDPLKFDSNPNTNCCYCKLNNTFIIAQQCSDNQICGMEMRLPKEPHLTGPLRPKPIFIISLDANDRPSIKCCINLQQQHSCSLEYGVKVLN